MVKCPGQDQRFWKPGDIFEINCPNCGAGLEFWKDEPTRRCHSCKNKVTNPKIDLGCAKWCQYAEHCLSAFAGSDNDIICQQLAAQMRDVFGDDQKRIDHALGVLSFAEQIQRTEGGDPLVVKAAAILHDNALLSDVFPSVLILLGFAALWYIIGLLVFRKRVINADS